MDNDNARILRGLTLNRRLNAGGTADTYQYNRDPLVVLKETRLGIKTSQEAHILGHRLQLHKGIVYLLDYEAPDLKKRRPERFLLEYCDGGDLHGLMHEHQDYMPEAFIWHVFLRLAETLAFMHYGWIAELQVCKHPNWRPVIHRDLKPPNIFLKQRFNDYPDIILGDFGHAADTSADDYKPHGGGTPEWEPPERPLMTEKADIWALGVIIQSLIHNPFHHFPIKTMAGYYDERYTAINVSESRYVAAPREEADHWYSRQLYYWMAKCLSNDPSDRPSALELARDMVPHARGYRDAHYEPL